MGFCSRCGERLHGERRCDCGGNSVTPRSIKILRSRTTTPNEDADPWRRQYVSRSSSSRPSSSTSNRNRRVGDNNDDVGHVDDDDRGHAGGTDGSTDLLQAPAKLTQSTLSANGRNNQHPRPTIPRTASQQSIEEITRSFGSVLDPEHQRKRWSCAGCMSQFIRDQTVFLHPPSKDTPELQHVLFCQGCFTDKFSLGDCQACSAAVLPDAAVPFIQRESKLWHAVCYTCSYCQADLSQNPMVDLYGNPCCADCFDCAAFLKSPQRNQVSAVLSAKPGNDASSRKAAHESEDDLRKRKIFVANGASRLGPSLQELRTKLSSNGLQEAAKREPSTSITKPAAGKLPLSRSQPQSSHTAPAVSTSAAPQLRPLSRAVVVKAKSDIGDQPVRPVWARHRSAISTTTVSQSASIEQRKSVLLSKSAGPATPAAEQSSQSRISLRHPGIQPVSREPTAVAEPVHPISKLSSSRSLPAPLVVNAPQPTSTTRITHVQAPPILSPRPISKTPSMTALWESRIAAAGGVAMTSTPFPRRPLPQVPQQTPAVTQQSFSKSMPSSPVTGPAGTLAPVAPTAAVSSRPVQSSPLLPLPGEKERLPTSSSDSALSTARCAGCHLRLFSTNGTGGAITSKIIRVADESFHARCFICSSCYKQIDDGQYVEMGPSQRVHARCAPPIAAYQPPTADRPQIERAAVAPSFKPFARTSNVFRSSPSTRGVKTESAAQATSHFPPSKSLVQHLAPTKPAGKVSRASEVFLRNSPSMSKPLGGMYLCPACDKMATFAETIQGPLGSRFHRCCLVCQCGKRLDSNAKSLPPADAMPASKARLACRDCIDKSRLNQRSHSRTSQIPR